MQKSIIALKKLLRDQKTENEQLQADMLRLKKTLKNTRMNELMVENR